MIHCIEKFISRCEKSRQPGLWDFSNRSNIKTPKLQHFHQKVIFEVQKFSVMLGNLVSLIVSAIFFMVCSKNIELVFAVFEMYHALLLYIDRLSSALYFWLTFFQY